jgi:hypothetical protein
MSQEVVDGTVESMMVSEDMGCDIDRGDTTRRDVTSSLGSCGISPMVNGQSAIVCIAVIMSSVSRLPISMMVRTAIIGLIGMRQLGTRLMRLSIWMP